MKCPKPDDDFAGFQRTQSSEVVENVKNIREEELKETQWSGNYLHFGKNDEKNNNSQLSDGWNVTKMLESLSEMEFKEHLESIFHIGHHHFHYPEDVHQVSNDSINQMRISKCSVDFITRMETIPKAEPPESSEPQGLLPGALEKSLSESLYRVFSH